ncbi:hypothetical protein MMC22_006732 [Lobaria immixta]|nr:hypothetical protein [Lobaria immixta]
MAASQVVNKSDDAPPPLISEVGAAEKGTTLEFLRKFDTIFLIDDSFSMISGGSTSWDQAKIVLEAIVPVCAYFDKDGIDIYFLNASDKAEYKKIKDPKEVKKIFEHVTPDSGTPTGQRLKDILNPYLRDFETYVKASKGIQRPKPVNIIVITDGKPNNPDELENYIINTAKKLDALDADYFQVGIQFFQVGQDEEAAVALHDLDDNLAKKKGIRDIVDTEAYDPETGGDLSSKQTLKVVLGAVDKRLDKQKKKEEEKSRVSTSTT